MFRSLFMAALVAGALWMPPRAEAQVVAPNCEPFGAHIATAGLVINNRQTPLGPMENRGPGGILPSYFSLMCSGGTAGAEVEVEVRFVDNNLRADPWGGKGVFVDSTNVAGIGYQLVVASQIDLGSHDNYITSLTGADFVFRRVNPVHRVALIMNAYPVKIGDIDLSTFGHKMQGQDMVEVRWRLRGAASWNTWMISLEPKDHQDPYNILNETCYFGDKFGLPPFVRNHQLRPLHTAALYGLGKDGPIAYPGGTNTLIQLRCNNFLGGRIRVESPSRHPTLPGILTNGYSGPDAAAGVGLSVRHGSAQSEHWDFLQPWPLARDENNFSIRSYLYYLSYYQMDPVVTPGRFSATITMTIEYN